MTPDDKKFETHIEEPRFLRYASISIALALFATWVWLILHATRP